MIVLCIYVIKAKLQEDLYALQQEEDEENVPPRQGIEELKPLQSQVAELTAELQLALTEQLEVKRSLQQHERETRGIETLLSDVEAELASTQSRLKKSQKEASNLMAQANKLQRNSII